MSSTYPGIYKGVVVDNQDPLHTYRVVAQVPAVLGNAYSNWCDPILPTIYAPRVGEVVWVQFADGDPAQPLYQSRVQVIGEMIDPGSMPTFSIDDFSIDPTKMLNSQHYLY